MDKTIDRYNFDILDATVENLFNYLKDVDDSYMILISEHGNYGFSFENIDEMTFNKLIGKMNENHKFLYIYPKDVEIEEIY